MTELLGAGGYKKLRHSLGLVATTAAVSLVCTHDKSREFVDRLWMPNTCLTMMDILMLIMTDYFVCLLLCI